MNHGMKVRGGRPGRIRYIPNQLISKYAGIYTFRKIRGKEEEELDRKKIKNRGN